MSNPFAPCLNTNNEPTLAECLQQVLRSLPPEALPLREACLHGGMIDASALTLSVLEVARTADGMEARLGVFFTERVGGCSCHDVPVETAAYAEIALAVQTTTGEFRLRYLGDD